MHLSYLLYLLLFTIFRKCKPVEKLSDLKGLRAEYYQNLTTKMNFLGPRHTIQKYTWPIVQKFNSLVAIGGRQIKSLKSVKTTPEEKELHSRVGGYLVPLMNQILTGKNYEPPSDAPLAIIICPDWPEAQSIANICADLGKGM